MSLDSLDVNNLVLREPVVRRLSLGEELAVRQQLSRSSSCKKFSSLKTPWIHVPPNPSFRMVDLLQFHTSIRSHCDGIASPVRQALDNDLVVSRPVVSR